MHWCVSVNSDTGVFMYMSACEGGYGIPVERGGSCEGHPNWYKVKETCTGRRGHQAVRTSNISTYTNTCVTAWVILLIN